MYFGVRDPPVLDPTGPPHHGPQGTGKAYEEVPALICDRYARHILCAAAIWGDYFAHREQNSPPKYVGNKSDIAHLNFVLKKKSS